MEQLFGRKKEIEIFNEALVTFSNDVYVISEEEGDIIRKKMWYLMRKVKQRKSVFPVMITPFGCEKNMYFLGLFNYQLDLNCLFIK